MNTFDKFFTKFAYKFPKGYPDLEDTNDVKLLEDIFLNYPKKNIFYLKPIW